MKQKVFHTRTLVIMAMLIALQIVLRRLLSINTPIVSIGFGFVPVSMAGVILGPIYSLLVGAIADILGTLLFPSGYPYFPGYTFTAAMMGLCYGVFLHKKVTVPKLAICLLINQFILSLLLNTFWNYYTIYYFNTGNILAGGNAIASIFDPVNRAKYLSMLIPRITQVLITTPIQFVLIYVLGKQFEKLDIKGSYGVVDRQSLS